MTSSTIVRLTAQELEAKLCASKGGNVPGITEDHRYEMMQRLTQTRRDDEEVLHAMRFLGCDDPEIAIQWLAEQDKAAD